MKIKFELPPGMEMKNLVVTDRSFEWDVVALRGQAAVGGGFITVTGAGGRKTQAVLRTSVKNGATQALKPEQLEQAKVEFDLSTSELQARKEKAPKNLPTQKPKAPDAPTKP